MRLTLFIALLLLRAASLPAAETITIPVDSPAFLFSPGNWTGDQGRTGKVFRQTWNPYAYFRVSWESGMNLLRVTGLEINADSKPIPQMEQARRQ